MTISEAEATCPAGNMFQWLSDLTSPRGLESVFRAGATNDENNDQVMCDLVLSEIEEEVGKIEAQEELRKSQISLQNHLPDYSWLAVNGSPNRRRVLTQQERTKIESAAELLWSDEWNQALLNWRGRLKPANGRTGVIDAWSLAVHEIVAARPRPASSVADQLVSYLRHRPSVNQVQTGQSPRSPRSPRDEETMSNATELSSVSTIMPLETQRPFAATSSPSKSRVAGQASVSPLTPSDVCDLV